MTSRAFALALALVAGLVAQAAAAPPKPHDVLRAFMPDGKYIFEKDGKQVEEAVIYYSPTCLTYLIVVGQEKPLLVRKQERRVDEIVARDLIERDDGGRDIRSTATPRPIGTFQPGEHGIVALQLGETRAALKPKPWLLGWQKVKDLTKHTPQHGRRAALYMPDAILLASAKAKAAELAKLGPVELHLYFGSWCGQCERFMPAIIHVDQQVKDVTFKYFGLPHWKRDRDKPPEARQLDIKKLPAGVLYVNGVETNRITGAEWEQPERALDNRLAPPR